MMQDTQPMYPPLWQHPAEAPCTGALVHLADMTYSEPRNHTPLRGCH